MTLIKPFRGLRPNPEFAQAVIAPPYDVVTSDEARELAKDKPQSFLHISRPEIDLPVDVDPHSDAVYHQGLTNFTAMLDQGVLQQDTQPCFYLYRIIQGNHQQTGLVAAASVQAYNNNLIKKHELTRPDKQKDRETQIATLKAQTGPVMLTCRHQTDIQDLFNEITIQAPIYDVAGPNDTQHQFWVVDQATMIDKLNTVFNRLDALYIADGHHRSAAAAELNQDFLSVIIPDDQLQILSYNRVIADLNGYSQDSVLEKLTQDFTLSKLTTPTAPSNKGEFTLFIDKQWHKLVIKPQHINNNDTVKNLDVTLLHQYLIEPIFNIHDPRRDPRIDFVGGSRGLEGLMMRVTTGSASVAIALPPTSMDELLAVADSGNIMPPKSTWFEPKLADGLISLLTA